MGLTFEVPGEPRGKGRPRFTKDGHAYTDSETRAYEKKIIAYYKQAFGGFQWPDSAYISVDVVAVYQIPKSATKASRAAIQEGKILPRRKPDIDNVLKVVLDSLNGFAYKDDAQVVMVPGRKIYGHDPKLIIEMKGSE
jgi:Holliday junction resolvase RusA-like endonuclease